MSYNRFSCLDNKYPQNTLKNKNKNKNNVFDYISFPELVSSKNKTPENIYNFKKILTDTNEYIEPLVTKQEFILPGWEKLTLKRIVDILIKWGIITDVISMKKEKFMGI